MFRLLIHRPKWIVAIAGLLIFWLARSDWLTGSHLWQKANGALIDRRYLLRGQDLPNLNIRLVGLCSSSFKLDALSPQEIAASPTLEKMQEPWPWDRSVYAAILEKLMKAGAKVVLFDFVFASETEGDDTFAKALNKYKDHVVIGEMITEEKDSSGFSEKLTAPNNRLLLADTTNCVGLVNIWTDSDDVVRRARYLTSLERETTEAPDISPQIIEYLRKQIRDGKTPDNLTQISALAVEKFTSKTNAVVSSEKRLINFQGPPGTYRPLPVENMFVDALWKKPPFENGQTFSNKLVIVGPMAEIFHDVHQTPYGEMPGPEVQAQMAGALLQGTWLMETSQRFDFFLTLGAMIIALLICLGIPQAWLKGFVLAAVTVIFLIACQLAFTNHHVVLPMMPTLFCLLATGSFGIFFEYMLEQLDKRRYRNVLDRYVSKNVAKTILNDRRSFVDALKGRKQPVTVLFSDIRGFTTMTEKSDADKLVTQLNEYFGEMVEIIQERNRGTLQKFIGDAIMAVWGDTHSHGNDKDALGAVTAALHMRKALAKLNTDWKTNSDRTKLSIGIGVNHGEVIVGNVGAKQRMEFTVLGDGVNLAARLESATKQFHTDVLVGEEVERLTRKHFVYRTVDLLTVKGKTKPVEVFALLSDHTEPVPAWLTVYEEGIRLYRARNFADAAVHLKTALHQIGKEDFLCEMYISRCEAYEITAPPSDWDGSFTLAEK